MVKIKGTHTKVGVQSDTKREAFGDDDLGDLSDMVTVAAVHEFGAPRKGIPQRSFLRSTFDLHQKDLQNVMAAEKDKILLGGTIEDSLDRIGLLHTAQVQARIRSNIPPPLADATVEAKGSSRALIDTGQLVQSIRHINVVRK
jgi:hypothetical protein